MGGQCLMSPPGAENSTYPFTMYYVGGALMNFIGSAVFLLLSFVLADLFQYAQVVFIAVAVIGTILGILNILPLKLFGLATDGRNVISMKKSEQVRRAHWLLLTINVCPRKL